MYASVSVPMKSFDQKRKLSPAEMARVCLNPQKGTWRHSQQEGNL